MGVIIMPLMDGPQSHLSNMGRSVVIYLDTSDQNALAGTASASDSIYNAESGYSENLTPDRRMVSLLAHDSQATWVAKLRQSGKPVRHAVDLVVCITAQFSIQPHCRQWSFVRLTRHDSARTNRVRHATTFRLQQQGRLSHACKTASTTTFKFLSQNARSICVVMFKKCAKSDAMILKSRRSRTVLCYRFDRGKPNPLAVLRFGDSPIARQQLSGIPQDGRATGVNRPASYPARCLASCPSVVPAIARKIHHPAPQHPRQRLAGQPTRRVAMFASQLARRASGFLRNISPDDLQEIHRHDFNPDSPKHEFIHTVANARSRKATPSSSGISAAAASCSFQQPDTVP